MRLAADFGPQVHSVQAFSQRLPMLDSELSASLLAVLPDLCNICVKGCALAALFRGELFSSLSCELDGLLPMLRLLLTSSGSSSEGGAMVSHIGAWG